VLAAAQPAVLLRRPLEPYELLSVLNVLAYPASSAAA
jgi:hypothetical protein